MLKSKRSTLKKIRVILSDADPVVYDDLIIGLGCEDKYHNIPGAEDFTYSIQTIEKVPQYLSSS